MTHIFRFYGQTPRLLLVISTIFLSSCGSIMSSASNQLAKDLAVSIQNHNDPDTVASAIPAYLIMLDGMILRNPESTGLLQSAAKLYGAYASIFVTDIQRARHLSQRALDYASKAACLQIADLCQPQKVSFAAFQATVQDTTKEHIDGLFTLGQSWAVWLQSRRDDWNAIAELPRIRLLIEQVLKLDDSYQQGSAHLYMGILQSLLPENLGGKPQLARQHFEKAISLSDNKNLMAKVSYAEHHARLVFDKELHDRLLKEVLESKTEQPGLTLLNTLAKQKARALLESGKDYF